MSFTIICADDHEIVRYGLCLLLDNEPDIEVVGEAANGEQALTLAESLHPQFIVLDLTMPGLSGAALIRTLRERFPEIGIIVLSMHKSDAYVLEALRAGAAAYVLKESEADEVATAIREVAAGHRYLTPCLRQRVLDAFGNGQGQESAGVDALTPREFDVIQLAAQGLTSAEIGKRLFISTRTAETHRAHAMHKLGLRNQIELVRYFIDAELQRGLD
ncbi:MAG: response regulator transcription factor [Armatimonadia bacterium]